MDEVVEALILCVQEAHTAGVNSEKQALLYIGRKLRAKFRPANAGGAGVAETKAAQRSDKHVIDDAIDVLHR